MTAARPLADAAPAVLAEIAAAARLFCLLDFDGTLAPIAPTPAEARPLRGTADLLCCLAAAPETAVALVSGRTIDDLRARLDVPGAWVLGIHGLETLAPDGSRGALAAAAALGREVPWIRARLDEALAAHAGILIEDKGVAVACHFRLASRAAAAEARWTAAALVRELAARGLAVELLEGHEVVEIRPAAGGKGAAVRALLERHGAGALPLYIGDDRTDEEAFAALPPVAVTVRVAARETPTAARFLLPDPEAVASFLRQVLAARLR